MSPEEHEARIGSLESRVEGMLNLHHQHLAEIAILRTLVIELARQIPNLEAVKAGFLSETSRYMMKDAMPSQRVAKPAAVALEKAASDVLSLLQTLPTSPSEGGPLP